MKREYCSLYEELLPLYKEGGLKEETKRIIEKHLETCESCFALYNEDSENIFAHIDIPVPELPKEKSFLYKVKKTLNGIIAIILGTFIAVNALAYAIGRNSGIYGERFRLAEQKNLFLEVNQQAGFGDQKIVLEKVLLDSTVTSIIFKTSVDINTIDSITLKDDKENFYSKTHTFFNSVPQEYQKVNGYTVLNFKPVSKDAKKLIVELIDRKKNAQNSELGRKAVFELEVKPGSVLRSISENKNAFQTNISDFVFSVDTLIRSTSQTELCYKFNYEASRYDGITLGWYHREYIDNKNKIAVTDAATGHPISVLSTEDITHELLVQNPSLRKTKAHKVLLDPLSEDIHAIKLEFTDVYGYYNLNNQEIEIDVTNNGAANINRTFQCGSFILDIVSWQAANGSLILNYKVKDSATGNKVKDIALDARVRPASGKDDVPEEGEFSIGSEMNQVAFQMDQDQVYVVSLARLGEKIDLKPFEIQVR